MAAGVSDRLWTLEGTGRANQTVGGNAIEQIQRKTLCGLHSSRECALSQAIAFAQAYEASPQEAVVGISNFPIVRASYHRQYERRRQASAPDYQRHVAAWRDGR